MEFALCTTALTAAGDSRQTVYTRAGICFDFKQVLPLQQWDHTLALYAVQEPLRFREVRSGNPVRRNPVLSTDPTSATTPLRAASNFGWLKVSCKSFRNELLRFV